MNLLIVRYCRLTEMLQFLDKSTLSYAALFGLQQDVVRFTPTSCS